MTFDLAGFRPIPVLDHGYVQLVETWGSDSRIVESARMSTQKGFIGWGPLKCDKCDGTGLDNSADPQDPRAHECSKCKGTGSMPGDEKLLAFLWKHRHTTPFEFAGLTIEVQAPIFVFREWHRHRTQSYTEASARYSPLPNVNYVPSVERLLMGGGANRQAQSTGARLSPEIADMFRLSVEESYTQAQSLYEAALRNGVPKELARIILPVGRYSKMRASTDLWNWLHFLRLRMDPNAQWEIQQYANAVADIIAGAFPRTWELFNDAGPEIS